MTSAKGYDPGAYRTVDCIQLVSRRSPGEGSSLTLSSSECLRGKTAVASGDCGFPVRQRASTGRGAQLGVVAIGRPSCGLTTRNCPPCPSSCWCDCAARLMEDSLLCPAGSLPPRCQHVRAQAHVPARFPGGASLPVSRPLGVEPVVSPCGSQRVRG